MGSLQQICLRWNNHQVNFPKVFDALLQNSDLVDVTLSCEGQKLKAHKVVLSACSPYFHSLFQENPCKHPVIVFRDTKFSELQSIIEFMYKGEVNVPRDELGEFIRTAQSLQVKGIAEDTGDSNNDSRLKHPPPNLAKKKSPPPLTPARKPASPSIGLHSNNNIPHLAKKPRLQEQRATTNFRESPVSMVRESTSPYREYSIRESLKEVSSTSFANNHQVSSSPANNAQNSDRTNSPATSDHDMPDKPSSLKKEPQDYSDSGREDGSPNRHGIDLLMESTMETGDEQFVVGEGSAAEDEGLHDQSDDGSGPFDDSVGPPTGPSTSFSEGHQRKQARPRKAEPEDIYPYVEALWSSFAAQEKPRRYKKWTEDIMVLAIRDVMEGGARIMPTAKRYGIPDTTLWDRIKKIRDEQKASLNNNNSNDGEPGSSPIQLIKCETGTSPLQLVKGTGNSTPTNNNNNNNSAVASMLLQEARMAAALEKSGLRLDKNFMLAANKQSMVQSLQNKLKASIKMDERDLVNKLRHDDMDMDDMSDDDEGSPSELSISENPADVSENENTT